MFLRPVKAGVSDHSILSNLPWSASGHTIDQDVGFQKFKAVAMACDNGAELPSIPAIGQWFLHTPPDRNILYMFDGLAWIPIISLGSMTVYVDNTDGLDVLDKGYGLDTNAFKTIQFAIDAIPGLFGGDVTINVNGETYPESLIIRGKKPTGNYFITLQGTLMTVDAQVAAATSIQGNGATQGMIIRYSSGTWTVNQHQNKLVRFVTGPNAGETRVIDSNDATSITIVGTWPYPIEEGNDFIIEDWATEMDNGGITDVGILIDSGQENVIINDLKVENFTTSQIVAWRARAAINRCYVGAGVNGLYYRVVSTQQSNLELWNSFVGVSSKHGVEATRNSVIFIYGTKIFNGNGNKIGCRSTTGSALYLKNGSVVDGYDKGLLGVNIGMAYTGSFVVDGYARVRNNTTYGIRAQSNSIVTATANVQLSGNGTDLSADAATYSTVN